MAEIKLEDAPQSIRTYYDKGIAAMARDNLEYAMDMFETVLSLEPRLLEVRKWLREAAIKKSTLSPPGKLVGAKGMPKLLKATALQKTRPLQALELSEKLLRTDPFNLKFSKVLCDAAKAANLPEVAVQTLEILNGHQPDKLKILEPLAELYSDMKQLEQAYECRVVIAKLKPNDMGAQKELKDAAARLTMGKTGWQ